MNVNYILMVSSGSIVGTCYHEWDLGLHVNRPSELVKDTMAWSWFVHIVFFLSYSQHNQVSCHKGFTLLNAILKTSLSYIYAPHII